MRATLVSLAFSLAWLLASAPATVHAQQEPECFPRCREGFVCLRGKCVSACNPPCADGEHCTAEAECVPQGASPSAGTTPQPQQAQPQPQPRQAQPQTAPDPAQPAPAGAGPTATGQNAWGGGSQGSGPSQGGGSQGSQWKEAPAADAGAPGFGFLLRFGPTFSWYAGGHFGLGFAFGLSDGVYFLLDLQTGGGVSFEDGVQGNINFVTGGGGLGVRVVDWSSPGWVVEVGAAANYLGEIEYHEDGIDYAYAVPHARLGGGVLFASEGRFAWSIEGTLRLGYAINTYSWNGVDYGGFYGGLDLSLVLSL